jgi:hypothetical protein
VAPSRGPKSAFSLSAVRVLVAVAVAEGVLDEVFERREVGETRVDALGRDEARTERLGAPDADADGDADASSLDRGDIVSVGRLAVVALAGALGTARNVVAGERDMGAVGRAKRDVSGDALVLALADADGDALAELSGSAVAADVGETRGVGAASRDGAAACEALTLSDGLREGSGDCERAGEELADALGSGERDADVEPDSERLAAAERLGRLALGVDDAAFERCGFNVGRPLAAGGAVAAPERDNSSDGLARTVVVIDGAGARLAVALALAAGGGVGGAEGAGARDGRS